jgi:hypothetical protein
VRQFPLVLPDSQNQSLVERIATEARKLVHDPSLDSKRAALKADIDLLVRQLYQVE